MKKNLDISKRTSLKRTYFDSSLALRYIEVPLYLILFIYCQKVGGRGEASPAPPPARSLDI